MNNSDIQNFKKTSKINKNIQTKKKNLPQSGHENKKNVDIQKNIDKLIQKSINSINCIESDTIII